MHGSYFHNPNSPSIQDGSFTADWSLLRPQASGSVYLYPYFIYCACVPWGASYPVSLLLLIRLCVLGPRRPWLAFLWAPAAQRLWCCWSVYISDGALNYPAWFVPCSGESNPRRYRNRDLYRDLTVWGVADARIHILSTISKRQKAT